MNIAGPRSTACRSGSEKLQNVDGKYIFALQNVDLRYFILKKATDYMVT